MVSCRYSVYQPVVVHGLQPPSAREQNPIKLHAGLLETAGLLCWYADQCQSAGLMNAAGQI